MTVPARVRNQPRPAVLRVAQLIAHPANVREDLTDVEELANSIRRHGLLQPLTVAAHPTVADRYLILAGHRRARAAMLAGLLAVPCVIRDLDDRDEHIALMLVENCQRVDLSPMEQAQALGALRARGHSGVDLALMTGKSDAWVSYRLGLLDLPEHEQAAIAARQVTVAEAEALVRAHRKVERGGNDVDRGWEPPYLVGSHPLARKARAMCDGRGHNLRRRVGKVACGQCWEWAIREDERTVIAVAATMDGQTDAA